MKPRIVYVEDDLLVGQLGKAAMEDAGFDVHYQTSPVGLDDVVKAWRPQLLLLDVEVGGANLLDLLPGLRRKWPDVPVVFVTSHHEGENVMRALDGGAADYVKKPFTADELVAHVRYVLKSSHAAPAVSDGSLVYDEGARQLLLAGTVVARLSNKENCVFGLLYGRMNETVETAELLAAGWGEAGEPRGQSLLNVIARLRRILPPKLGLRIENVHGKGYRLASRPAEGG